MPIIEVPEALRERLGPDGTKALVDLFNQAGRETRDDVIVLAEEKFGRRLAESTAALETRLTERMAALETRLTRRMAELETRFTERVAAAETRLLRWSFVFWATLLVALFLKDGA